MPWKEENETVESKRTRFVAEVLLGENSKSALCRKYGISRPTGDKWIDRYKNGEPMSDRSHEPYFKPNKTEPEKEAAVLSVRTEHPTWGPRKLHRYLTDRGYTDLPATSTIAAILKRNDKITPEDSEAHIPYIRFVKPNPNDMWQMDFKGHFGMLSGEECHPLTVSDDHSRFLLCLDAYANERWGGVKGSLIRVFKEYGLPKSILSDNGKPWGDCRKGHTLFDIWMMQMDVLPIHGRIRHPQTQGKEERFHLTLKRDLLMRHPINDLSHAQEEFDKFRYCYNFERPHDALGLDVPDKHYKESTKRYPQALKEPLYDIGKNLRKVNCKGYISVNQHRYYLGESYIGKYVEVTDEPEDRAVLNYGNFKIAVIDLNEQIFLSRRIFRR